MTPTVSSLIPEDYVVTKLAHYDSDFHTKPSGHVWLAWKRINGQWVALGADAERKSDALLRIEWDVFAHD